jgi:hypothetical protein
MHRVFATVLLALICGVASVLRQQTFARPSAAVEELLWWLPSDTETVMVTQVPARRTAGPLFEEMATFSERIDFGDTTYAKTITRHLRSARLKTTIEGSRHFTAPSGLGEMPYEGATIYLFAKSIDAGGNALMTDLERTALSVERIEGFKVLEFRDKVEDDILSSYITIPRPDVLLQATNREYLKELLGRTVTHTGQRALPEEFPEWRWVDARSPFWAIRHYRHEHTSDDPSSPFRKGPSGIAFDTDAVGVAAHANADGRTVVAHYLSKGVTAETVATRLFKHAGDGVSPTFRRAADDAIEVRFIATDGAHLSMFFFYLFGTLGHGTYL